MDCVKPLSQGGFSHRIDNGSRLHLQHGPIDLIILVESSNPQMIEAAYERATTEFNGLLGSLAKELVQLRQPANPAQRFIHPIAKRMNEAAACFHSDFVTPMAAVAGSVAEHIKACIVSIGEYDKVLVNNGGDIALHLSGGSCATFAVCADVSTGSCSSKITLHSENGIGGVATSGWQGRSHSLGIADAVTVLAESAALADVAATLIANAVNTDAPAAIERVPANELSPDSDLGNRLVTTSVGDLSSAEIDSALSAGVAQAQRYLDKELLNACYLQLQGKSVSVHHEQAGRRLGSQGSLSEQSAVHSMAASA